MQRSSTSADEYLASLPDPLRTDLLALDARIAEVMGGQERVLWDGVMWGGTEQRIIGYGAYRYVNRSGVEIDWFVVGLAAQKNHLSLYVNAAEDGSYLVKRYADRLGNVKAGSANVTFKRVADVDLDVLVELVARARELMVGQSAR
ncbi:MAG: DUF1801 domain-containing protein [Chloroflexota bacterium]